MDPQKKLQGRGRAFVNGIFHGMGAVVGGIFALALIGWILSLLGVIPGFDRFETYLGDKVDAFEHRPR